MCCESRKLPAGIVGCLAFVTLILSVVMILLAFRFNAQYGAVSEYSNFAFIALLAASIIACMAACCGIAACRCTNRCIAVCFGCTLLPAALFITGFGFVLTGVSHTDEETLNKFCTLDYTEFENTEAEGGDEVQMQLRETIDQVDYQVGSLVSKLMCSNVCPCDISDLPTEPVDVRAEWLALSNDNEALDRFDRCNGNSFFSTCSVSGERVVVFYDGYDTDSMVDYDIQAYSTFSDCFDDLRSGNRSTEQVSEEKVKEYQDKYNKKEFQQAMKFISFFEKKWTCSGICATSMFYYSLPMSDGPPTETCLLHMKDEIQNNLTYMGMAAFACGIVMLVTWLCQYLLWKKYDDTNSLSPK